jgi:hypothetical protein
MFKMSFGFYGLFRSRDTICGQMDETSRFAFISCASCLKSIVIILRSEFHKILSHHRNFASSMYAYITVKFAPFALSLSVLVCYLKKRV